MKIVYLHQYFNSRADAGGSRSYEMARRLVSMGHEVHMVTTERSKGTKRQFWTTNRVDGIYVHRLPVQYSNRMNFTRRILAFVQFAMRSAGYAAKLKGDVVFATSTPLTIAVPGVFASRRSRCPMVFEVRDLWPEVPIAIGALKSPLAIRAARWLERFAYRNSTRIVALSPGMTDGILRVGYPATQVELIPNAADLDLFDCSEADAANWRKQFDWLGDLPMVLYCGTLGRVNRVGYLAEVAVRMRSLDSSIQFVVVGDGAESDLVRQQAQALGVLGLNFHMLPSVPKSEVPRIFAAATVSTCLFAPIKEMECNSANKFFDSLAAGTPLAINYGGWHAMLLEESGAGIVLDPHNYSSATDVLYDFIRDTLKLQIAGQSGRSLARAQFARDELAMRLESVLQEAVLHYAA